MDPFEIEARRRAGELLALRPEGEREYVYPAWQFDRDWRVRPELVPALARARERGVDGRRLADLLARRVAMTDRRRLVDVLLAGDTHTVLAAIEAATAARRE